MLRQGCGTCFRIEGKDIGAQRELNLRQTDELVCHGDLVIYDGMNRTVHSGEDIERLFISLCVLVLDVICLMKKWRRVFSSQCVYIESVW